MAFLKEKGLYVVALLCLLVVGGAAYLAYAPQKNEAAQPTPTPAQVSSSKDERLSEATRATPTLSPVPTVSPSPAASAPPQTPAPTKKPGREKRSAPVKGSLQWGFAAEELIYSATLHQWMTHNGIDIAAAKGSEVYAVWGGTVDAIYEDEDLGVIVEIAHSDGLRTVYANLAENLPVKEGQRVNANDPVGQVGNTSLAECADPSHLHFEIYKDEKAVDPLDYILLLEE
ncbi:MAG: M23 family metallopeptidase [Candidatus Pelethousia sp.]|nr:M23 family metallopeptidase [Candidatus Pelethousia sp.]